MCCGGVWYDVTTITHALNLMDTFTNVAANASGCLESDRQ